MRLSYKRPDPSPHVFGGFTGRRREEAVGAALNIQARCLRAGKSDLFKLRDVRGAFTNVTHESVRQHLDATQRSLEAAIHHNQHLNTVLRTPGGGDWRITKGTRQGDFGCDKFLGVYDIPLKKYVNSRQPTNEVMKLEDQNVDVSLLTFVDDLMDILIESTPGSMKMRDTANDKRLTQELRKVGCELEPSKESLLKWMGPNARKTLPNVAQGICWGPVVFHRQSGTLDAAWKSAEGHPRSFDKESLQEKEEKGSSRSKTLFGVFGFEAQGDRGQKRGLAASGRGAGARGGRGAGSKSLPKSEPRKRQTSSHGSKKSDISSWFTKRAFSYQSGQSGPAATDHHRETGQAPCHGEQAIDHQTKGDVGANAQNVHEPGTSSHGDCSVRVVQYQEI